MSGEANGVGGATAKPEEISGRVTKVIFSKETFTIGVLARRAGSPFDDGDTFKVSAPVKVGEAVTLRGTWETHAKFGKQFKATELVYTMPADADGLVEWLRHHAYGIGSVKARKLVEEFGVGLTKLWADDPGQVAIAAAVPIETIQAVAETWAEHAGKASASTQLFAWGLTSRVVALALLKWPGGGAVKVLNENPYLLAELERIGWAKADQFAGRLGVVGDDERRLRAAIAEMVSQFAGEGHTVCPVRAACDQATGLVMGDDASGAAVGAMSRAIETTVGAAVESGTLRRCESATAGVDWLATPEAWRWESAIWKGLRVAWHTNGHGAENIEAGRAMAAGYAKIGGKELDAGQLEAVANAATFRVSVVTGGAGAGKTLVASAIAKLFADGDTKVMLCAPTGKAARRLEDVIGRPASTIHRLLGFKGAKFTYDRSNPLPAGVVIADEMSMADTWLLYSLMEAVNPAGSLVLIGDPNQLPPVGPGSPFRDIIAHDLAPVTRLAKCHRQAGTLKQNCSAILDGRVEPWAVTETPCPWVVSRRQDTPEKVTKLVVEMYGKHLVEMGFDPVRDTQFITAQKKGVLGTPRLNLLLQRLHQKSLGVSVPDPPSGDEMDDSLDTWRPTLFVGDKVIHTKNNYKLDVMNGTVGFVTEVGRDGMVVRYDEKDVVYENGDRSEVSLAYCLTVHKVQGSEYPCVVTIVPKQHTHMHHRNWLYTACTRAQRTCVIVGDDQEIRRAAERVVNDRRVTLLDVFARYEDARP